MCKTKRGLTKRGKIGKVKSERLRFGEFSKSMACVYKYFLELYIFLLIIEKKNLRRKFSIVKQYVYVCAYCSYVSKLCPLYSLIWSSRNLKKTLQVKIVNVSFILHLCEFILTSVFRVRDRVSMKVPSCVQTLVLFCTCCLRDWLQCSAFANANYTAGQLKLNAMVATSRGA